MVSTDRLNPRPAPRTLDLDRAERADRADPLAARRPGLETIDAAEKASDAADGAHDVGALDQLMARGTTAPGELPKGIRTRIGLGENARPAPSALGGSRPPVAMPTPKRGLSDLLTLGGHSDARIASAGKADADAAVRGGAPPRKGDAYAAHIDGVRAQLASQGLPVKAKGAQVFVVDTKGHGDIVTRTAVGRLGLADGAKASLLPAESKPVPTESMQAREAEAARIERSDPIRAAALRSAAHAEGMIRGRAAHIEQVLRIKEEGPATLNMSFGDSVATSAISAVVEAIEEPNGPLAKELAARLGKEKLELANRPKAFTILGTAIEAEWKAAQPDLDSARKDLAEVVARSRQEKLLTFVASGNQQELADKFGKPSWTQPDSHGVNGLVLVGAADMRNPRVMGDEKMAPFSGAGATIAAPGVGISTGPRGQKVEGTSFSSPYASGATALAWSANPSLSADDVERLLIASAHDVKNETRDGAGVIDPVRMVKAAVAARR